MNRINRKNLFKLWMILVSVVLLLSSCASVARPPALSSVVPFREWKQTIQIFTTEDYRTFHETKNGILLGISLPLEWSVQDSLIVDSRGRKVAEFSPGFVGGNAEVFDRLLAPGRVYPGPDSDIRILAKDWIQLTGRKAIRMKETAAAVGGMQRPTPLVVDRYFLSFPDHLLIVAFQYASTEEPDDDLVKRILDSATLFTK